MSAGTAELDPGQIVLVHQLLARYGHVVDAAQWHRFEELFTPDVVVDYTGANVPEVLTGIEAVRTFFASTRHPVAHHVVNIDVWQDGDAVRVTSKYFTPYTRPDQHPHRMAGGDYDDVVVHTPQGWRFASRSCTTRWQLTQQDGPVPLRRRSW